jgi:hypothetical protein
MWTWTLGVFDAAMMASLAMLMTTPPGETRCTDAIDGARPLRVRIVRGLPPLILKQAREDVEEIWRRQQIAIEWVATEMRAVDDRPDLLVSFADRPPSGRVAGRGGPIAWIMFDDGRPTHFIQVSQRAAIALFDSKPAWDGLPTSTFPMELRERALGRIIGRALAHEIGHYLLGSSGHALSGLMRAVLPDTELVTPGRRRMWLSGHEAKALRARLQSTTALAPASARCR